MALGSGSSLATDCWRRRKGFPCSDQLLKVGKANRLHQHSSSKPTAHSESAAATSISRSRRLFSLVQGIGRGDPAFGSLCQHTPPRRRAKVARMVSPETRLSTRPSSKATCAAISSVQRLVSLPNSLGERWSNSRNCSALFSSKAAWVLLGREDLATKASNPRSLKSWMASRTVCCPQPRFSAICGTSSPLEEARSICERRKVKVSLERNPASSRLRSSFESVRTKIGGFMPPTVTHNPKLVLDVRSEERRVG